MGTWCNMSDGEDFGAVVRANTFICSTPFDSNTVSFTQLLTNTATAIYDDVFLGGCEASEENPLHNTTCFSTAQEIFPLSVTNMKQELDGAESIESVVFKSPPPAEKAVDCIPNTTKTHKNPHSSTKLCSSSKIPGIKKRKNQQRRIMRIPMAEGSWNKQGGAGVPSDLWSWRKYGQKPIKGSPYPRGYYRCSSSKGCPARKQLERSFTDPTMLVITYTEDHNHAWPANRRSSAQNSLDEKTGQPLSLFVPHTPAKAKDNQDAASPQNESQQEKQKPNSEVVDSSSFEEEDQYLGDNHMLDDNLFSDFGEPPELYNKDFLNHSDEEDGSTMVDPFNLFDWSFSTNEMPIHDVCF